MPAAAGGIVSEPRLFRQEPRGVPRIDLVTPAPNLLPITSQRWNSDN